MRIKENFHDGCDIYSDEMKQRVTDAFQEASQISELKSLLTEIRTKSDKLQKLFLTEKELNERREAASEFNAKIREEVSGITQNLEAYRAIGWKALFSKGEADDE